MHGLISKHLPKGNITKNNMKDTLNYILNKYYYKSEEILRTDYITRNIIVIILKYDLNQEPRFIEYKIFRKELEETICVMTGKEKINTVDEIIKSIEEEPSEENSSEEIIDIDSSEIELQKNKEDTNVIKEENCDNKSNSQESIEDNENTENISNFKFNLDYNNFIEESDIIYNMDIGETDEEKNKKEEKDSSNNDISGLNVNQIIMKRKEINLFTLGFDFSKNILKNILLENKDEELDIKSLEGHIDILDIEEK